VVAPSKGVPLWSPLVRAYPCGRPNKTNKMNNRTIYNPHIHHRRSIRLKGYDYSQAGLYFITICCQNRACLFGDVVNKEMKLNDAGTMVENEWLKLPNRFQNIQLHEFVVMPNHFHAILEIVGATLVVAQNDAVNENNANNQMGQPQGIAHPVNTSNDDDLSKRQPQGFAHPVNTSNDDDLSKGQPQGFAHPVNTSNDDDLAKGQPQGIAHPVNTSNDDDLSKGQPQGIAHSLNTSNDDDLSKGQPQGIAHPVNTSNDDDLSKGQPQGFAHPVNTSNDNDLSKGQPQGFAHPVNTSNDDDLSKGQPQGIAHPVNTSNDNDSSKGQPQGIAHPVNTSNDDDLSKGQPQGIAHPVNTSNDDDSFKGQPQGIAHPGKTVGNMIGAFQSIVTVEYIRGVKTLNWQPFDGKLWQRNYYEHIIRNEQSYLTISNYIKNNPAKWADDKFYKK